MNDSVHTDISKLLGMLQTTEKKYDTEKITRAYEYANELHQGQFRASGEPYISHPIAVAEIVAGLELDTDSNPKCQCWDFPQGNRQRLTLRYRSAAY